MFVASRSERRFRKTKSAKRPHRRDINLTGTLPAACNCRAGFLGNHAQQLEFHRGRMSDLHPPFARSWTCQSDLYSGVAAHNESGIASRSGTWRNRSHLARCVHAKHVDRGQKQRSPMGWRSCDPFDVTVDSDLAAVLSQVRSKIVGAGGNLTGDTTSGAFSGSTAVGRIEGQYPGARTRSHDNNHQ
jgi:hypothetical protein